MLYSSIPVKFPIPWGNSAGPSYITAVPVASQITITPGVPSLTDGYVPLNATPIAGGGIPPFMQYTNGLFKQITQWVQWQNAGGLVKFDATFSGQIGGYPAGALVLSSATSSLLWLNTVDNNTNNPDSVSTGWLPLSAGTILLPDGTAALPGLAFASAHATGLYRIPAGPGLEALGISVNGVIRVYTDSAFNIGFGGITAINTYGSSGSNMFVQAFKSGAAVELSYGSDLATSTSVVLRLTGYTTGSPDADKRVATIDYVNDGSSATHTNGKLLFSTALNGTLTLAAILDKNGNLSAAGALSEGGVSLVNKYEQIWNCSGGSPDVGAVVLAKYTASGTFTLHLGDQVSGAFLQPCNLNAGIDPTITSMPGTWELCGFCDSTTGGLSRMTNWHRVS